MVDARACACLACAQICGLDVYPTQNGPGTRTLAEQHVRALRANECTRNAKIVLLPECNLANEAQEVSDHLLGHFGDIEVGCVYENKYGVVTAGDMPGQYVFRMANKLAENAVAFHHTGVCGNPWLDANLTQQQRFEQARRTLEQQLQNFRKVYIVPQSLNQKISVRYTGKTGNDNQRSTRQKDDLAMALMMGIYWSGQHLANKLDTRKRQTRFQAAT